MTNRAHSIKKSTVMTNTPQSLEQIVNSAPKVLKTKARVPKNFFPLEAESVKAIPTGIQCAAPKLSDQFLDSTYFDEKIGCEMPTFVILGLERKNPVFSARVSSWWRSYGNYWQRDVDFDDQSINFEPRLNRAATNCFTKFLEQHEKQKKFMGIILSVRGVSCYFSFKFNGIIPEKTRKIAKKAKDNFDGLYLVCDATNKWIKSENAPEGVSFKERDPLLIGVKRVGGLLEIYLLDKFDLTFAEDYVTKEFVE